jgi:hypothetical protein
MAAPNADHSGEVDIVERALAILEEESRSWVTRQRGLASPDEITSAADELPSSAFLGGSSPNLVSTRRE